MDADKPTYLFHITHVDNLAAIIADGRLWSDRRLLDVRQNRVVIGLERIKRRRLEELLVHCHSGTHVGDYVPFYFCPRSPMLYTIHMRNAGLAYRGGQLPIVHLVSTVELAMEVAEDRPWAFSDGNAGARYTQFRSDLAELPTFVDWDAVRAKWWRGPNVDPTLMNGKMAEFLVHDWFPWTGLLASGVSRELVAKEVREILKNVEHQPEVSVKTDWYY